MRFKCSTSVNNFCLVKCQDLIYVQFTLAEIKYMAQNYIHVTTFRIILRPVILKMEDTAYHKHLVLSQL